VTVLNQWLTRSPLELQRLQKSVWLFDSLMLAVEAQHVIGLRLAAIVQGGTAAALEARLMVTEKIIAAQQAAEMLAQGAPTEAVISFYRSQVQANVRRLTQKPRLVGRAKQKILDTLQAFGWPSRNRV
jgi:hypothetical protein